MEGQETLDFSRTDGQWHIEPEGWIAENGNLNAISEAMADPKIADLISTSGNPGIYSLDETQRVLVKAWIGDDVVRA